MEKPGPRRAVILANGEFPRHPAARGALLGATTLILTDGAYLALEAERAAHPTDQALLGLRFLAVVGDGDSLGAAARARLGSAFIEVKEQEENDLTKATRHCLGLGIKEITYLGIGGGRDDHALGNLALLVFYHHSLGLRVEGITNYGRLIPSRGPHRFASRPGQQVSVFNFGCSRLESIGLKWPTHDFDELWQGTLNEACATEFAIDADGDYLVYLTHGTKQQEIP
ncbi:MAG: thiamine pyrophosphokinase [Succinivibrionaceae bacterium]|nr:thiamine pyrophosphokinase [Succinivibrionaceae bacterium]